jgi:glycerol-3-phosphate acyltransferase PlsY
LTRWRYGEDIRALGDRNVGAGNVWQVGHRSFGVLVAAIDVIKGMAAVWIARWLELSPVLVGIMMLAAVAGHAWPIFLRFWGGGGVATGGGALLAAMPMQTLVVSAGLIGLIMLTRRPKVAVALGLWSVPLLALWQGDTRGLFVTTMAMPFIIGTRVFQQGLARGLSRFQALQLVIGVRADVAPEATTGRRESVSETEQ